MIKKFFIFLLFYLIIISPVGVQSKSIEGEATGSFPFLKGTGTLTFTNTGGEARLTTVCDESANTENTTCTGADLKGTFSGGPNGVAVFSVGSGGEVRLQLTDGKVFSYSAQGVSFDFTVTDPSIFDDWVEGEKARDSGARVSDLNGQIEIACPPDLEAWDVMKMGRVIYVDCHIKTGEDSNATISFSDMTIFKMKPETEIVIDTPPEKDSKWSLIAGNIWVNVKQMVKDGTMKVHMSQAVAGIKGTKFVLSENGKESKLEVLEGKVEFTHIKTNEKIYITAGGSVTATVNGFITKTKTEKSKIPLNQTQYMLIIISIVVPIFLIVIVVFKKQKK